MIFSIDSTAPDPSVASNIQTQPFVRLPDPGQLFLARTSRFATLPEGHGLAPDLRLLSGHRFGRVAEALATLDIDLWVRESNSHRGGGNPFLVGS
ncbi:MAG: hypothetical protein WBA48_11470 [Xanthobacteraceae bacterium]